MPCRSSDDNRGRMKISFLLVPGAALLAAPPGESFVAGTLVDDLTDRRKAAPGKTVSLEEIKKRASGIAKRKHERVIRKYLHYRIFNIDVYELCQLFEGAKTRLIHAWAV